MNSVPINPDHDFRDPGYLWGQLIATRALLLRVAGLTTTKEDLRESGLEAIEILRNTDFPCPMPESFLAGLDDFENWLKNVS